MPKALEGLVAVIEDGEEKYTPAEDRGWMQYDPKEVLDSLLRHLLKVNNGEFLDPESGKPHAWHIHFNAAVFAELTTYCFSEDSSEQKSLEDLMPSLTPLSKETFYGQRASRPPSEPDPAS